MDEKELGSDIGSTFTRLQKQVAWRTGEAVCSVKEEYHTCTHLGRFRNHF